MNIIKMKIKTQPINTSYAVTYDQAKQARKEYLKKNYRLSKKPWFVLVSGKQYNYETRHESWGDHTKWFRKPSETKILHDKNTNKSIGRAKYMESLAQHKLNKWIRNNPAPNDKQNLFYEEFLEDWEEKKENKLIDIRKFVIELYDKTVVPYKKELSEINPIVKPSLIGKNTPMYEYKKMDPFIIGYPLCKFAGLDFVKKEKIIKACKQVILNVNSKQYGSTPCCGARYRYNNKIYIEIAA